MYVTAHIVFLQWQYAACYERCVLLSMSRVVLQMVEYGGPAYSLGWCKRKQWLVVGGKAELRLYDVSHVAACYSAV